MYWPDGCCFQVPGGPWTPAAAPAAWCHARMKHKKISQRPRCGCEGEAFHCARFMENPFFLNWNLGSINTLLETNICPEKSSLKITFPFPMVGLCDRFLEGNLFSSFGVIMIWLPKTGMYICWYLLVFLCKLNSPSPGSSNLFLFFGEVMTFKLVFWVLWS